MPSAAKKLSITIPAELERALAKKAKSEHRSMSGIIQESAKYYLGKGLEEKTFLPKRSQPIDVFRIRRAYELIKNAQLEFSDGKTAEEAIREMRDSR